MRIAELSGRSGVPVATIKYYLREHLLPAGERTGPNQASYGEDHVRRLRLIRAMLEVGRLSVATVKSILEGMDEPGAAADHAIGVVSASLDRDDPTPHDEIWRRCRGELLAILTERGWRINEENPALAAAATAMATAVRLDARALNDQVAFYARISEEIAERDIAWLIANSPTPEDMPERVVLGTVIGDRVLQALRRLAHANESYRRFGADHPEEQTTT